MVQRRLTDEALRPDILQEFLPGHHTVPVLDEMEENIEDLRLQGAQDPRVAELVELSIQGVVIEKVHRSHLSDV
jgi:hypothetical protein